MLVGADVCEYDPRLDLSQCGPWPAADHERQVRRLEVLCQRSGGYVRLRSAAPRESRQLQTEGGANASENHSNFSLGGRW